MGWRHGARLGRRLGCVWSHSCGEAAFESGIKWAEDEVDAGTHAVASFLEDVPVLGSIAEVAADATTFAAQAGGGILEGAASLVGGVADSVLHPIDTARGLENMAEHMPIIGTSLKFGHGLLDIATGDASLGSVMNRTFNPLRSIEDDAAYWGQVGSAVASPYRQSMAEGRYGELAGRGVFDVATLLSGAGEAEAAKVVEAGSVARAAEETSAAARVVEGTGAVRATEGAEAARSAEAARAADGAGAGHAVETTEPPKADVGRQGKQRRLRELGNDTKVSSADRGWIQQDINQISRGKRSQIRLPKGKQLAHERGREAAKGYDYAHSHLQDEDLHKLQHKHDDFGRKNPERPIADVEMERRRPAYTGFDRDGHKLK